MAKNISNDLSFSLNSIAHRLSEREEREKNNSNQSITEFGGREKK
jgi:hypothetical protein